MTPDQVGQITTIVTGGAAATVLLAIALKIVWSEYQKAIAKVIERLIAEIADVKAQRDANLAGWKAADDRLIQFAEPVEKIVRAVAKRP